MTLLPERQGYPAPPEIAASREAMKEAVSDGRWKTARPLVEFWLGNIRVLRVVPVAEKKGAMIHFHGGGYRTGCPEMDAPFAERLAHATGLEILLPAYRLAPEYPCPAGINDGFDVLELVNSRADNGPIFLSGASAGGGLAASLAVIAAEQGLELTGLVLLSAWLDLRLGASSWETNAGTDQLFPLEAARIAADLYLQRMAASDPLASPLLASLGGLPPTFISVGAGENLCDDARAFHAAMPGSVLSEIECMDHVAVTRDPGSVGAEQTFAQVVDFIRSLSR